MARSREAGLATKLFTGAAVVLALSGAGLPAAGAALALAWASADLRNENVNGVQDTRSVAPPQRHARMQAPAPSVR
ncbi:MAG TPA: hypothetical protein VEW42_02715 [Candidatus Eisenbacteria bacterium]|nr:hypothetical protein [Candidatus Eisenbacteria bacterium]